MTKTSYAIRLRTVVSMVPVVLAIVPLVSVHPQSHVPHGQPHPSDYVPAPGVTCKLQAELKPDSALIDGMLEIVYRNLSEDTLRLWRFSYPNRHAPDSVIQLPRFHMDSILYRGVPLHDSQLTVNGSGLTITSYAGLGPGETAFFLLTFRLQLTQNDGSGDLTLPHLLSDWLPQVGLYREGEWLTGGDGDLNPEPARFFVDLTVDTSYSVVFPGTLINEREHRGLLPPPESGAVRVDVLHDYSRDLAGNLYVPQFESGVKHYYVRLLYASDFPMLIHRNFLLDRAVVDSIVIDVWYPPDYGSDFQYKAARDVERLLTGLKELIGDIWFKRITVAAVDSTARFKSLSPFIVVDRRLTDYQRTAALAQGLAEGWRPIIAGEAADGAGEIAAGVSGYVACELLFRLFGEAGYDMFEEYGIHEFHSRAVLAWLHITRWIVGDDDFWSVLKRFGRDKRFEVATRLEVERLFAAASAEYGQLPTPEQIKKRLSMFDMELRQIQVDRDKELNRVTVTLVHNFDFAVPLEMVLVQADGNMLYDTLWLSPQAPSDTVASYSRTLQTASVAVSLDPHYRLPDVNRENNFRYILPRKHRPSPRPAVFPGYRPPAK